MENLMKRALLTALMIIIPFGGARATTAHADCPTPGDTEKVHYTWRLRGGLSWIAGIAFPSSGTGLLTTVEDPGNGRVATELMIRGGGSRGDFYRYESEIERKHLRTTMTYHGYSWGRKKKEERTRFDYVKNTARFWQRSSKREADRTETQAIPDQPLRDVLTGIYYIRANAERIRKPMNAEIYSDGSLYPVIYKPLGSDTLRTGGRTVPIRGFEITARPGDQDRWPGGVVVWLTHDEHAIPVKISIHQSLLSLQLEFASAACGTDRIVLGGG
jgi:hypothetical protein